MLVHLSKTLDFQGFQTFQNALFPSLGNQKSSGNTRDTTELRGKATLFTWVGGLCVSWMFFIAAIFAKKIQQRFLWHVLTCLKRANCGDFGIRFLWGNFKSLQQQPTHKIAVQQLWSLVTVCLPQVCYGWLWFIDIMLLHLQRLHLEPGYRFKTQWLATSLQASEISWLRNSPGLKSITWLRPPSVSSTSRAQQIQEKHINRPAGCFLPGGIPGISGAQTIHLG